MKRTDNVMATIIHCICYPLVLCFIVAMTTWAYAVGDLKLGAKGNK